MAAPSGSAASTEEPALRRSPSKYSSTRQTDGEAPVRRYTSDSFRPSLPCLRSRSSAWFSRAMSPASDLRHNGALTSSVATSSGDVEPMHRCARRLHRAGPTELRPCATSAEFATMSGAKLLHSSPRGFAIRRVRNRGRTRPVVLSRVSASRRQDSSMMHRWSQSSAARSSASLPLRDPSVRMA